MKWVIGVLLGVFLAQIAFFASTIYLHRTLAHRALRLSGPATAVCRTIIWLTSGICPREWVAVHRKHHAFSDKTGDPHSPVLLGVWKVQWANVSLYRKAARDPSTVARYARDLPPDRFDRVLFDHGWLGPAIGAGAITAIAGWQIMLVVAVVHGVLYWAGSASINAIGHHWGRRPYDNKATNNGWLAILVAGEGLHNNHHAAPTSGRFSFERTEIDPAWGVIRVLVRLRLANVRHSFIRPRQRPRSSQGAGATG